MRLSLLLEALLDEDLGFSSSTSKPSRKTEKELRDALASYVLDNDRDAIVARIDGIRALLDAGKYKRLLSIGDHGVAYRFIDTKTPEAMSKILGRDIDSPRGRIGATTLEPDDRGLSSWTVNPRSLVYSGFFSVIPTRSHLALLEARTRDPNVFFGNPDSMAAALELDLGYALEREILAVGPVACTRGFWCLRDNTRSLEGQAMDLVDAMIQIRTIKTWPDSYYFPKT